MVASPITSALLAKSSWRFPNSQASDADALSGTAAVASVARGVVGALVGALAAAAVVLLVVVVVVAVAVAGSIWFGGGTSWMLNSCPSCSSVRE